MRAEHRRPLAAFVLVALACALVVGQSLRTATLQGLVDRGLPLTVLIPIAPDMLFTIDASGANGRGGDLPYVGRALVAVSRPAPPSRPVTTAAVATVPVVSPTAVVRTVTPSAAGGSARAAAPRQAPTQRAATATSGARTRTVAPARSTPAVSPGRTKPVPTVVAQPARTDNEGPSHQLNRGPHKAVDATRGQAGHHKQATRGETKHVAESHHQKQHQNQGQKQSPNGHAYGHQKQPPNGHAFGHQKQHPNLGLKQHPKQGPKEHGKQAPKQHEKQSPKQDQKAHVQQRH